MQYSQNDARKANWRQIDDMHSQQQQIHLSRANQNQYQTQDTKNHNPVIQSLSDRIRPDLMTDDMNSNNDYITESYNDRQNDNSYYINFADDNNSVQGANSNNHRMGGGTVGTDKGGAFNYQQEHAHNQQFDHEHQHHIHDDGEEYDEHQHHEHHEHIHDEEDDQQPLDDTMNDIFNHQQQQTSVFPNFNTNPSTRNNNQFFVGGQGMISNTQDSHMHLPTNQDQSYNNLQIPGTTATMNMAIDDQRSRQQKIKEMLKEFSKKKDKVIKEQIKQRVAAGGSGGQGQGGYQQQSLLSSKNSTSKQQIYFVDQHANNPSSLGHHNHGDGSHSHRHPTMEFTVEDDKQKTKYKVGHYKSVCGTCKSMKQAIELKKAALEAPKRVGGAIPVNKAEPAFIDVKKLKQKLNITTDQQFGAPTSNIQQYNQNSSRLHQNQITSGTQSIINPSQTQQLHLITGSFLTPGSAKNATQQHNLTTTPGAFGFNTFSNASNNKTPTNRYAQNHRAQELRDYSYDDLIKLIEQLERENAELRQALQDALSKLARMESRDDLILQYQNEVQLAKQRLNMNTQALKDVQNIFKLWLSLVNDLLKTTKSLSLDQNSKKKLTELANRMKQLIGGQDTLDKFESIIQDNNLQGLMQECLKTKVKNMHQQEILNMEREFNNNIDKMREEINDEVMRKFKTSIDRQNEDISDKQEQIDELKDLKAQLKEEIQIRDQKIEQMQQQLQYMEEDRIQLEEIVKEADQALQLKDQYALLQQEHMDMKQKLDDKLKQLQAQNTNFQQELDRNQKEKDSLLESILELEKKCQEQASELKKLDELQHLKEKMEEVDMQRQSFAEKEKVYEQKERNRKLLQEQLDDLEERYRLIEKAKKKLEIDLAMQKQTKEKLIEQNNEKDEDLKNARDEINQLISEKLDFEQQLQNNKAILQKVEAQLKDKKEFQKLEGLVQQVQSSIMLKSQGQFSDDKKQLIRELFGMQPGENSDVAEKLNELREENNKLYFEIRNEYDHEVDGLKKQKEYLKQLQDFSRAILSIDDKQIQSNFPLTMQKRNKAPLFSNVEQIMNEVQQRIDEIENRQRGLDRQSLVTGLDKYDDAFKKPQALSKNVSSQSLGGGAAGGGASGKMSLSNLHTPNNNRSSKRNLVNDNLESGGGSNALGGGSMFATMQTPRSNNDEHKLLPQNQNSQLQYGANTDRNQQKQTAQTVVGGSFKAHHKQISTISGDIMKDAVDDPQFIEELMNGMMDMSREFINPGGTLPNIQVDRATLESDFTHQVQNNNQGVLNTARVGYDSSATADFANNNIDNNRLRTKQQKLKNQIENVVGAQQNNNAMGGRNSLRVNQNRMSRKFQRQVTANADGTQNSRNPKFGMHNPNNRSINESGIYFFQDQQDIGDSFEVRVHGEGEIKSDLLQFIHCQAMFIEENKDSLKLMFGDE